MTQAQREYPAEVSRRIIMNCGLRKKSACLEKYTQFTPYPQFRITPQLRSTLLKSQPITGINGDMAANLLA